MREYQVFIVDSFTNQPFKGNPAGVVLNCDFLTYEEMKKIAAEMNLAETAFVLKSSNALANFKLRFFTITKEIDFCGHATLAAAWILADNGLVDKMNQINFETNAGLVPTSYICKNDKVFQVMMEVVSPEVKDFQDSITELERILGITSDSIDKRFPIKFAYAGNWDLIVPIKYTHVIDEMIPHMETLKAFQEAHQVTSVHLFTYTKNTLYTRNFAPAVGIDEDLVTGSTTAALIGYLMIEKHISWGNHELEVIQTNSQKREGHLFVKTIIHDNNLQIYLAGSAVCILKGVIRLLGK